jgi:hypothetical protein
VQVGTFPHGFTSVYSFWVGMEYIDQIEILRLCSTCDSIDGVAVFRDRKWKSPQEGVFSYLVFFWFGI